MSKTVDIVESTDDLKRFLEAGHPGSYCVIESASTATYVIPHSVQIRKLRKPNPNRGLRIVQRQPYANI